jgi:hypothetical protein
LKRGSPLRGGDGQGPAVVDLGGDDEGVEHDLEPGIEITFGVILQQRPQPQAADA